MSKFIATLLLFLFMTTPSAAQTNSNGIPIQKVVLYSSGVGYFEHNGHISGSATTELRFRAAQMNDVLKSLLLQDLDGGRIGTVAYPSQDPINKILGSFDIDLSNNPSLGNVLTQMRGSSVTISTGTDRHEGVILGVEQVQRIVDGNSVATDAVNIIDGGNIRSIPLSQVDGIALNDAALQDEFSKALQALAQARDQDKKPLLISHEGNGRRQIRIGYVVEVPVWKTSYRLVLPEEGETKGYLQGWSIVENQTENDWENIELSLVSGRPISFIQDLYNPLYVQRPVVQFELQENLQPQIYNRGMDLPAEADAMVSIEGAPRSMGAGSMDEVVQTSRRSAPSLKSGMQSVQTSATSGEVGELFEYVIGDVSLPRQRSAMIPIVTEEIEMERVSIYNPTVQNRHPLHGVRMKNSTKVHLMQGPATVLDENSYAGDARLNELPSGSFQLISYALDFELQIDMNAMNRGAEIQTAKISNGVLLTESKRTSSYVYNLENESNKKRSVIIEHHRRPQWELVDTEKPMESTPSHHRFNIDIEGNDRETFIVKEEQVRSQSIQLINLDVNGLRVQMNAGKIPNNIKRALEKAISIQQKIQQANTGIAGYENQIQSITTEQERIRENMSSVEKNSSYYKRLLSKLESQEDEIESLQKSVRDLRKTKQQNEQELREYLTGLDVN